MIELDCSVITAQAISLLQEAGLEKLTMRRLAERLDVSVSAIYWHFGNKQDLLDHVAEAILIDFQPDEFSFDWNAPWPILLSTHARKLRAVCLQHRDGARLFLMAHPTEKVGMIDFHKFEKSLTDAGFTEEEALHALMGLIRFVLGHAVAQQTSNENNPRFDFDAEFEFGLNALLEGYKFHLIKSSTLTAFLHDSR